MKNDDSLLSGLFAAQVAEDLAKEQADAEVKRERDRDLVGERLVADGYEANEFLLDINHALGSFDNASYPYPWNLPSRLFQFAIHTDRDPEGLRWLCVPHPLLIDHPLAKELIAKGYDVRNTPDDCYNDCDTPLSFYCGGIWHHAVDLIKNHHRELLDTRRFTTNEAIFCAVSYRCRYPNEKGPIDGLVRDMREVMTALKSKAPKVDVKRMRKLFAAPCMTRPDGKKKNPDWPVNTQIEEDRPALAWGFIHGIEQGWFQNVRGFLHWSEAGRSQMLRKSAA